MESQPQNPEFKNNPENFHPYSRDFCCLLITFANGLDPDNDQQNVSPDLDPNHLTL